MVDKDDVKKKYDLIFADLPFNINPKETFDEKIKVTTE